jgi:hypothetical protein
MARKKKPQEPRPNDNWEVTTEMQINGRNVVPGTELKISGETGRFRFVKYVKTEKGVEWLDVIGGKKGYEAYRSFSLDRVKTVHYKNKSESALAAHHKEKMKILREQKAAENPPPVEEDSE